MELQNKDAMLEEKTKGREYSSDNELMINADEQQKVEEDGVVFRYNPETNKKYKYFDDCNLL